MSYRPYQQIERRRSRTIHVGSVPVGGDSPITVQTMTNTLTTDVPGTIAQIRRAEEAGVDIVRVSCPDQESAFALKQIVPAVGVKAAKPVGTLVAEEADTAEKEPASELVRVSTSEAAPLASWLLAMVTGTYRVTPV